MRNVSGIINLLVFIFSLAGGIGVYIKRPKELLNRLFFIMMIFIACWSFVNFQCDTASTPEEYLFWNELDIFWYFAIMSLFHFSLVFSEHKIAKNKLFLAVLYGLPLLCIIIDLAFITKLLRYSSSGAFRIRYEGISKTMRFIFVAGYSGFSCLAMVIIFVYYRSDKCSKKKETLIALSGLLLGVIIGVLDEFIFPYFAGFRFNYLGTSPYLITNIFVAYAVIKYDILADASERLKETLGEGNPDENKEINKAYIEQKELLRKIIYYGSAAIFVKDREGRYILVNEQFQKTIQVDGDIIGKTDFDIFPHHVGEINRTRDLDVINRKEVLRSEDIHKVEGESTYVIITRFPLYNHDKDVFAVGGVITDITEQKKYQLKLQEALTEAEFLFNDTAIGLALIKKERFFHRVNKRFQETFGYTQDEIKDMDVTTVFAHQQSFEQFKNNSLQKIKDGEIVETVVRLKCKDDSLIWCKLFIKALHPPFTEKGIISAFEDITKEKQLEDFHQNVEQIMHHDLKNSLNAIIGIPSIMFEDENLTEDQKDDLQIIMDSGQLMLNQIISTLNVYKIEEGTYTYKPVRVDIIETIRRVLNMYVHTLEAGNIGYKVLLREKPVDDNSILGIDADESLLFTMLSNLFKNALEASDSGDIVTIRISEDEQNILIVIHNRGIIPAAIRPRFFEKFVTSGKSNGTGIGTYSARLMAGVMGGIIEFTTSEKMGTDLIITFPKEKS